MSICHSPSVRLKSLFAIAALAALGSAQAASPAWQPDVYYAAGTTVSYNGREYRAAVNQTDYASTGWNPTVATLWTDIGAAAPAPGPSPAPSPTPSPAPSPAPSPSQAGSCAAWSSAAVYTGGSKASQNGNIYRANWWTQGNSPATSSGPSGSGQPWTQVSDGCSGSPAPAPAPAPGPSPAPSPAPSPSPAPAPPPPGGGLSLSEALKADQSKRAYAGYYPSWSDNWFNASGASANDVYKQSKLARIPANYSHVIVAFANPSFNWNGIGTNSWSGTGIDFTAMPQDIKAAVDVLHQRNIKVILAVGGATYNNWSPLASEGASGGGPITNALAQVMRDVGFDGLDVDYEADADVDRYANATKAMRRAVDLAGNGRILTLAGWSTGADCTSATTGDAACAGKLSYWGGNAGRERQLVSKYPAVAAGFDMVNVMTYDARFEHYDGVTAYGQYRALFGSRTIVSIGFETAPEGFAGGLLVVEDGDAQCDGSRILQDSYGANLNAPYSVARYASAVTSGALPNRNPRDGAMIWTVLKKGNGACGSAQIATPGTIGSKVSRTFSSVDDPVLQQPDWR